MDKSKPVLSVIVPVYNVEQYIEKCVKSILMQNYFPLEIILVDDGSTDKSGFFCDLMARENDVIKAIHIKNSGITKARFAGARISRGRWITFVDADDWIGEDAYRDIVFERDCDVVITGICRYSSEKNFTREIPYFSQGIYNREEILNEIVPIMLWNPRQGVWALDPSLCTKIFKREIILKWLEEALGVGSNYGEDSIVIFPMMLQAENVRITERVYYYHRQRLRGVAPSYIEDEKFIIKLHKVYEYLCYQFKKMGYWDIMSSQLDCFYINAIELKKRCYEYPVLEFSAYFPLDRIPQKSKVVLYGAGRLGSQYWEQNSLYHFCDIVLWVDTKFDKYQTNIIKIENPENIKRTIFDYVLIAVDNYYIAKDIALYLYKLGVNGMQIIWQNTRADRRGFEEVL